MIREAGERSRERLGVERIDLYYAHVPDQTGVLLEEQVAAFGELVADGTAGLLGLSNHWAWQVERERALAAAAGSARVDVLQYHHPYLRLSLLHLSEPTRLRRISYAVFCLKKKKKTNNTGQ